MEADELKRALPDPPEVSVLWRRRLIQAVEMKECGKAWKAIKPTSRTAEPLR